MSPHQPQYLNIRAGHPGTSANRNKRLLFNIWIYNITESKKSGHISSRSCCELCVFLSGLHLFTLFAITATPRVHTVIEQWLHFSVAQMQHRGEKEMQCSREFSSFPTEIRVSFFNNNRLIDCLLLKRYLYIGEKCFCVWNIFCMSLIKSNTVCCILHKQNRTVKWGIISLLMHIQHFIQQPSLLIVLRWSTKVR